MPRVTTPSRDSLAPESLTRLRVLVVDDEKRLTDLLRLELDVEATTWTWNRMAPGG